MVVYDLWALTACTWIPGRSLKLIASSMSLVSLSMMMTSCSMAERCDLLKQCTMMRLFVSYKFRLMHSDTAGIICAARESDIMSDSYYFIRYSSPMLFGATCSRSSITVHTSKPPLVDHLPQERSQDVSHAPPPEASMKCHGLVLSEFSSSSE